MCNKETLRYNLLKDFLVANNFRIKLQESLIIQRDGPQLNKTFESASLMLYS